MNAVILHLFYDDLWYEFSVGLRYLQDFDLYISINDKTSQGVIDLIKKEYPDAKFRIFPNIGFDIRPFIKIYNEIMNMDYKYICKVHSKKSVNCVFHFVEEKEWEITADAWRRSHISTLLINGNDIIRVLDNNPRIGMLGCGTYCFNLNDRDFRQLKSMSDRLNYKLDDRIRFMAGTMFWVRHHLFDDLVKLTVDGDFRESQDPNQLDLSELLERMFGVAVCNNGFLVSGI